MPRKPPASEPPTLETIARRHLLRAVTPEDRFFSALALMAIQIFQKNQSGEPVLEKSLSSRGAWIETGRPVALGPGLEVAPPTGSVDRNDLDPMPCPPEIAESVGLRHDTGQADRTASLKLK